MKVEASVNTVYVCHVKYSSHGVQQHPEDPSNPSGSVACALLSGG
jgi:hypothetical protein